MVGTLVPLLLFALGLQGVDTVPLVQAESRGVRVEGQKAVVGKTPASEKPLAEFVGAQLGKSWAVVIGINEYEKAPTLHYAKADAESVAGLLRQQGFQVIELYDDKATRSAIEDHLGEKLPALVGEQDRVLIYFAGHGETKQLKDGKQMGFLLPVGGDLASLASTAISMNTIKEWSDGIRAKHVLFLVDACYGGIAGQQFRGGQPKYTVEHLKEMTREPGRQLITAGGAKQKAVEGPEWGHSVFTYYLLEGLQKGKADTNGDGIIPVTELYPYLNTKVFEAAFSKGYRQRPGLWSMSGEKGEFVFFTTRDQGRLAAESPSEEDDRASFDEMTKLKAELAALRAQVAQGVNMPKALESPKAEVVSKSMQEDKADGRLQQGGGKIIGKDVASTSLTPGLDGLTNVKTEIAALQARLAQEAKGLEIAESSKSEGPFRSMQLAKAYSLPQQNSRKIVGKDGAPMVLISAGSFQMGSTKEDVDHSIWDCIKELVYSQQICERGYQPELPQHKVQISAFYLDAYEVTNRLFQQFTRQTMYRTTAEQKDYAEVFVDGKGFEEITGASWLKPEAGITVFDSNRAEHPVVSVSWDDAQAYCRWAGKRLPTEAEFEYALRAGTTTKYWWGDGNPGRRLVENLADESAKNLGLRIMVGYQDGSVRTAPVGSYEANLWGLYDLGGNVREWTADWYDLDYYSNSPTRDPQGPSNGAYRVLRGGSWRNEPRDVRSADRLTLLPATRSGYIGFRCAQDVPK